MKRIVIPLFVLSMLIIACNNDKPKDSVTVAGKDGKEQETIVPNQLQYAAQDMLKIKEELGKLNPLSSDELRALIPEQLMGATPTKVEVNAAMGATVANVDYKINDSTVIKLEVVDCAGPGGVGLFVIQYMDIVDDVEESDEEITFKTIEFNGYKAFESCRKIRRDDCTFTYFSGNRFLISLKGDNSGIDILKSIAKELKITK